MRGDTHRWVSLRSTHPTNDRIDGHTTPAQINFDLFARAVRETTVAEHGQMLTDDERIDWLRLIRSEHVGPRGIRQQTHPALGVVGGRISANFAEGCEPAGARCPGARFVFAYSVPKPYRSGDAVDCRPN